MKGSDKFMIKKVLSLLTISILLFALSSCDLIYKKRGGTSMSIYEATPEEVANSTALFSDENAFLVIDFPENIYDTRYYFYKLVTQPDNSKNLEDFLNDEHRLECSWYANIFLDDCCPYAEDCFFGEFPGKPDDGEHRLCISVCSNLQKEVDITFPELLSVEERKLVGVNAIYYYYNYDGETILVIRSCQELSAEIIEEFREAILDAYSS